MLDKDHAAGPFADLGGEPIDALDDTAEVVFGFPVEEPNLHVDDKHCVHRGALKKDSAVR